jgi:hypothetical protein
VIVKINPRDVVSIPTDYNNAKGRACRYEVIGEVGANPDDKVEFDKPVQHNANSVKTSPKTGSSEFYRGYTDGYESKEFSPGFKFNKDYQEGFDKGETDADWEDGPRYQYVNTPAGWTRHSDGKVSPPPGTVFTAQDGAWPFPNK